MVDSSPDGTDGFKIIKGHTNKTTCPNLLSTFFYLKSGGSLINMRGQLADGQEINLVRRLIWGHDSQMLISDGSIWSSRRPMEISMRVDIQRNPSNHDMEQYA